MSNSIVTANLIEGALGSPLLFDYNNQDYLYQFGELLIEVDEQLKGITT
jgi:hypothetical protein